MPPIHRTKPGSRRPAPIFDRLEERALMTASTLTHLTFVPVHAEVTKHTTLGASATHSTGTVHAAVATHTSAKTTTTKAATANDAYGPQGDADLAHRQGQAATPQGEGAGSPMRSPTSATWSRLPTPPPRSRGR